MKRWFWSLCVALLIPVLGFSQGIRKSVNDMTPVERDAYVYGLNSLYNDDPSSDIVQILSSYYFAHFDDFYNTACGPTQFFYFHRMMLWELENALQHVNPRLTIPYWDWTVNTSPDDSLFSNFLSLDRIPAGWGVWREIASDGQLPLASDIHNVMATTNFCNDDNPANSFQHQSLQYLTFYPEWWLGGMSFTLDPKEPLFYLSHAMLDKLWQSWENTNGSSSISLSSIDRYDGSTGNPYLWSLPNMNPSDITDGRNLGVFYADNGVANLDGYQVSNTYNDPENFSYQYSIVATNFTVPSGHNAVFSSETNVTLGAGFVVDGGTLEIDVGPGTYDNSFLLSKKSVGGQALKQIGASPALEDKLSITRSQDGFTAHLYLRMPSDVDGYLMGVDGKIVSRFQSGHLESGSHDINISAPAGGSGLYYGYFHVGDRTYRQLLPKF